jgi:hypothetical protein
VGSGGTNYRKNEFGRKRNFLHHRQDTRLNGDSSAWWESTWHRGAVLTSSSDSFPWWEVVEPTTQKMNLAAKEIFCTTGGTLD